MPKYKLCHVTLPPESGVTVLKQNPTYLYQFKNSSNYFFRISLKFFKKMGYHHVDGHFVASLKTSDYEECSGQVQSDTFKKEFS